MLNDQTPELPPEQQAAIDNLKKALYEAVSKGKDIENEEDLLIYTGELLVPLVNATCFQLGLLMKMTNDGWDQERFSSLGELMKNIITDHIDATNSAMYMQKCQFCEKRDTCQDSAVKDWEEK